MAKTKKIDNFPSVLACEKKIVVSDGYMSGMMWGNPKDYAALSLEEKSVRGTISNRLDEKKVEKEAVKANLQRVDACSLNIHQNTLRVDFTVKVLSGVETPSACNSLDFQQSFGSAVKAYIDAHGFVEIASRYAQNIANGRFFWRNRLGAEALEVHVRAGEKTWQFNGYEHSLQVFEDKHPMVQELASVIADALCGRTPFAFLEVTGYAKVGAGQEVYPSQELVFDTGKGQNKGSKSKVLYSTNGIAALHSQKISNAIRTIDTWYGGEGEAPMPIATEPYGAVTNLGKAFRLPKEGKDFYTLFDKMAQGEALESAEDAHYVMSVLVRGGVFGKSSKED